MREFCATFYRSPIVPDLRVDEEAAILHWEREAKLPASNIGDNYIEQPVLVNIVELTEHGKEGRQFGVRSIVRLRSLDSCLRVSAKCGKPPLLSAVEISSVGNRELQSVEARWRISAALLDGNGINKIIESGAKIMNTTSVR